MDQIG